jgi:hypothetical protein
MPQKKESKEEEEEMEIPRPRNPHKSHLGRQNSTPHHCINAITDNISFQIDTTLSGDTGARPVWASKLVPDSTHPVLAHHFTPGPTMLCVSIS